MSIILRFLVFPFTFSYFFSSQNIYFHSISYHRKVTSISVFKGNTRANQEIWIQFSRFSKPQGCHIHFRLTDSHTSSFSLSHMSHSDFFATVFPHVQDQANCRAPSTNATPDLAHPQCWRFEKALDSWGDARSSGYQSVCQEWGPQFGFGCLSVPWSVRASYVCESGTAS